MKGKGERVGGGSKTVRKCEGIATKSNHKAPPPHYKAKEA